MVKGEEERGQDVGRRAALFAERTEDDAAEKKKKEMDRLVREEVLRLEREGVNATDLSEEGKNADGGGDDE